MFSRGKELVRLALEKNHELTVPVHNSNKTPDEILIDKTLSSEENDLTKIETQSTNILQEQDKESTNDLTLYRIQGTSISNIDSILKCNEDDKSYDSTCYTDNNSDEILQNKDYNSDASCADIASDDSLNDPDWTEQSYRKRYKCAQSSDYDSDNSISDKPRKRSKRMQRQNTQQNPIDIQSEAADGYRDENEKSLAESEILVAHPLANVCESQTFDREMSLDVDVQAIGQDPPDEHTSDNDVINDETNIARQEEIVTEEESNSNNRRTHPRAKKGMSNANKWLKNINKNLRMQGKAYKGLKGIDGGQKKSYSVDRNARIQGERNCKSRCKSARECFDVSDDVRKEIFDSFWKNMDWREKRTFVASMVSRTEVSVRKCVQKSKQSTPDENNNQTDIDANGGKDGTSGTSDIRKTRCEYRYSSRRKYTYRYNIRVGNRKLHVCKDLFLSTLGLTEHMVYDWLDKFDSNGLPKSEISPKPSIKVVSDEWRKAEEWLNMLPNMPSHYCRSTTNKRYLEPVFTSFMDVYRVYQAYCSEKCFKSVSRVVLKRIFERNDFSIFQPKKDQCDVCVSYCHGNTSIDDYNAHIKRKDDARSHKENEKRRASDSVRVLTMDVQSVLLSPRIEASAVYYKTKLASHNFTIYDLKTKDVKCYFWHEGEGGLTANSFVSCICDYIENELVKEGVKEVIIFSDGCGYQNRNQTLANALLRLSVKYNIEITQNYLEKGHTQMEVDSTHSSIECCLKKRPIYCPGNYVDVIKSVRSNHPYMVKYIDHTFFGDYTTLKFFESIRPGYKSGDPIVNDIRCLKYKPDGTIQYKISYTDNFIDLQKRRNAPEPSGFEEIPKLYKGPLQIKKSKYEHLQQLKDVIPRDYHPFYDALKHT